MHVEEGARDLEGWGPDTPVAVKYLYSAAEWCLARFQPPTGVRRNGDSHKRCFTVRGSRGGEVRVLMGFPRGAPVMYFGGFGVPKAP